MNPNDPINQQVPGQTVTPQGAAPTPPIPQPVTSPDPTAPATPPVPQPQPAPIPPQPIVAGQFGGAPQQPVVPIAAPLPSNGGGNKIKYIIAGVIVLVIVVLAGVLLLKGGSSGSGGIAGKLKGNSDVVSRSDGKLDLTGLIDKDASIKNQDIKGDLNQQLNMVDGVSFMVTKIEPNYQSPDQYSKPDDGKQFIAVHVVVGNKMKTGTVYFSPDSLFKLKNVAGGLVDSEYGASSANGMTDGSELQPGEQKEGIVVFSINPNDTPIYLVYSEQYDKIDSSSSDSSNSSDKADATVTGSIKLQ